MSAIEQTGERAGGMSCAVRHGDNIRVVIGVVNERRSIPALQLRHRMQLEMAFTCVLGVKSENAAERGPLIG